MFKDYHVFIHETDGISHYVKAFFVQSGLKIMEAVQTQDYESGIWLLIMPLHHKCLSCQIV